MASPELRTVIELLRKMWGSDEVDVAAGRARLEIAASLFQRPPDVQYEPVDAGGVCAEWTLAPGGDPERVLVYFHGGAYTAGSVGSHRALVTELARVSGMRVLNVDYRLAPEHPHPAAVEDAVAAARFLRAAGVDPARTAFAGDSAGGGLTVAALIALRDAGDLLPGAAVCLSPWTDLSFGFESIRTRAAEDPMVRLPQLAASRDCYVAGGDPKAPLVSPVFADLTGLPPLFVQVGSAEILLDDSRELVARATRSGVDATLEVWDDMIHVFQAFFPMLPEGRQAIENIAAFLRARLA